MREKERWEKLRYMYISRGKEGYRKTEEIFAGQRVE